MKKRIVFCAMLVMAFSFVMTFGLKADAYGTERGNTVSVLAESASAAKQLFANTPLKATTADNGTVLVKFRPAQSYVYKFAMEGEEIREEDSSVSTPVTNISAMESGRHPLEDYCVYLKAGTTYYLQFSHGHSLKKDVTISVEKYTGGAWTKGFSWKLDSAGTLTISGSGAMPSYQDSYDYPWYIFQETALIKKVVIGTKITSVGKEAFYDYSSITSVVLPEGLVTIGTSAFSSCSLKALNLPSTVTTVGESAFEFCDIKSLPMGKKLREIKGHAFADNQITSLSFPYTLKKVGAYAFQGNKIKTLTIPATLTTGKNAFFDCNQLTTVTFAKGTKTIGNGVCNHCKKLKKIKLPSTVKTIGTSAFSGTAITSITIPKNVTNIKTYAFEDCRKLKKIKIPKKVKKIGKYAIGYKDGLVKPVRMKGFLIKGVKNSAAQKYAKKNKINFKIVKK